MSFKTGDVFKITDTLYSGVIGSWHAVSVPPPHLVTAKGSGGGHRKRGIIPNQIRFAFNTIRVKLIYIRIGGDNLFYDIESNVQTSSFISLMRQSRINLHIRFVL